MSAITTGSFPGKQRKAGSISIQALKPSELKLPSCAILLILLLAMLFLGACKTIPIDDRNATGNGGFWEQDENSSARFHNPNQIDKATIGLVFVSGEGALSNGTPVDVSAKLANHSRINTGPQSSARVEFEAAGPVCTIEIDEFNAGNAYADTADCRQQIETPHARIDASNAILHLQVTEHQTKVTVISGTIDVTPLGDTAQSIDVREDREVVVTRDTLGRPYLLTPEEIWQRIRWRDDYPLYKKVIDWGTIAATAAVVIVTAGIIAAVVILSKGHGHGGRRGLPGHR